jgi:translation initiation factor 2 alpha subunit (eIF-2alpha)
MVYMKQYDVDYYRDISFGNFIGEVEYPEIVDIFWYNIDDDQEKEMFAVYKYYMRHYDFTGYVYDVCVLDNPSIYSDCLESLDLFGNLFVGFEGMTGDYAELVPPYTSKEEVIKKLKEMGYKS